jgi:hypothetical protein
VFAGRRPPGPGRELGGFAVGFIIIRVMAGPISARARLDRSPGELNLMNFANAARLVVLKGLVCMMIAGGTLLVGCSPAEVGSNPSSKGQISDYMAKQSESSQLSQRGKKSPGAFKGPQSIKKRLFNPGSENPG